MPLSMDATRPVFALDGDGTIEGYASLFGVVDAARDMVMPGAFAASLRARGVRRIPMLFQHDPAEPIGIWLELKEDLRGLYVRGRLIPDVGRARELIALIRAGTADGLSIGYRPRRARIDPRTRVRALHEIDLWEISIVTLPLLDGARVSRVKGLPYRISLPVPPEKERSRMHRPSLSPARARAEAAWRTLVAPACPLSGGDSFAPSETRVRRSQLT
jgi:HK97 family phage prohead protease